MDASTVTSEDPSSRIPVANAQPTTGFTRSGVRTVQDYEGAGVVRGKPASGSQPGAKQSQTRTARVGMCARDLHLQVNCGAASYLRGLRVSPHLPSTHRLVRQIYRLGFCLASCAAGPHCLIQVIDHSFASHARRLWHISWRRGGTFASFASRRSATLSLGNRRLYPRRHALPSA